MNTNLDARILALIDALGGMSSDELARATNTDPVTMNFALYRLLGKDLVSMNYYGIYCLTKDGKYGRVN